MNKKKLILIIDDEPDIVYTIKEICLYAEYDVITASNGLEGIKLFEFNTPNLIIMDYHMPKYDGLITAKKIREMDQTVAILVLTVNEQQDIFEKFIEAGVTDFSLKPVKAPDLISRINVNMRINEMQLKNKQAQENVFVDKGISVATLSMIEAYLEKQTIGQTIKVISSGVELSYQTVHRYILYMLEKKQIEVVSKHGKVGRPLNYYRKVN